MDNNQSIPSTSSVTPTPVQNTAEIPDLTKVELSFLQKLQTPAKTLWQTDKVFVIIFGILILAITYRNVIMNLIAFDAKKTIDNTQKKSDALQTTENQDSAQADALVKQSNDLASQEGTVDENWNKKT